MKTLSQILELYKPKSQDEDKFVKKHIVVKHRDRNGNGDDVFQATNVKAVGREKERHGYEPGKDEEVYEQAKWRQNPKAHTIQHDYSTGRDVKVAKGNTGPEDNPVETEPGSLQHRQSSGYNTPNRQAPSGSGAKLSKQRTDALKARVRAGINRLKSTPKPNIPEEVERLGEGKFRNAMAKFTDKSKSPFLSKVIQGLQTRDAAAAAKKSRNNPNDFNAAMDYANKRNKVREEKERLDEIGDDPTRGQPILARVRDRALERREKAKADISNLQDKQDAIAAVHGEKAARNMPQHKELGSQIERKFKEADGYHDTYDAAKARIDPARRSAMGLSKIKQHEQVEYLDEKLKVSDGIGAWISDFIHSDNPMFEGVSRIERMKMAQAAFYSAQKGD